MQQTSGHLLILLGLQYFLIMVSLIIAAPIFLFSPFIHVRLLHINVTYIFMCVFL